MGVVSKAIHSISRLLPLLYTSPMDRQGSGAPNLVTRFKWCNFLWCPGLPLVSGWKNCPMWTESHISGEPGWANFNRFQTRTSWKFSTEVPADPQVCTYHQQHQQQINKPNGPPVQQDLFGLPHAVDLTQLLLQNLWKVSSSKGQEGRMAHCPAQPTGAMNFEVSDAERGRPKVKEEGSLGGEFSGSSPNSKFLKREVILVGFPLRNYLHGVTTREAVKL